MVRHPFDNLVISAMLVNCKDNTEAVGMLEGKTEETKKYQDISNVTKIELKKLKVKITSQQNKGNLFLVLKLFAEQKDARMLIGSLVCYPMHIYSHKNLLPENQNFPR